MQRRAFLQSLAAIGLGSSYLPAQLMAAGNNEYDFFFTRLSYESGDWEVDERTPANILNALIEYTTIRVDIDERVIALADPAMLSSPFCYLAGHRPGQL